jgi:hypothetical protein
MSLGFFIKTAGGLIENNLAKVFKVAEIPQNTDGSIDNTKTVTWYQLPENTCPSINGSKIIAMSQIVDGVAVFERISRAPYSVKLDFTLYQETTTAENVLGYVGAAKAGYIFPIDMLNDIVTKVWKPGTALKVDNILFGTLGIMELIVEEITIEPVLGSVNVNVSISCLENYYRSDANGQTLIVK